MKIKFPRIRINYKLKISYIIAGSILGGLSIFYSGYLVKQLAEKEVNEIKLWTHAMTMASDEMSNGYNNYNGRNIKFNRLLLEIIKSNTTPSVITDNNLKVVKYTNVDAKIIYDKDALQSLLEQLASKNNPIEVNSYNMGKYYIFYGESNLLRVLRLFPYLQICVIICFMIIAFSSYRYSKQDEQKRIWIGMAKETAHQLGTPTSSLLGWLEYLRLQEVDKMVVDEIEKDVTRLLKVVDRFSKIGSETVLSPKNITEMVSSAVNYFQRRIPKNVSLTYDVESSTPQQAMVNEALFEWVIENLLKNALDALQGKGTLAVSSYIKDEWIYIDVKDTGKGIASGNIKNVFNPGFTTKTRGWGLGLSLSKRIICEYHKGKIMVAESVVDKGTTMRVMLKKL